MSRPSDPRAATLIVLIAVSVPPAVSVSYAPPYACRRLFQMMTVIPKDCLLCDVCNEELVSGEGEVLAPCLWTEWGLICARHPSHTNVVEFFAKGERVPKSHQLWLPIVITDWPDGDSPSAGSQCMGRSP